MSGSEAAGRQLYAHLAELLAPAEALGNSACLVILEPAGKDVAALGATTGPELGEALADLANTVPAAAASFLPTLNTYDDLWKDVLTVAVPTGRPDDPASVTVSRLLADNRATFEMMARARLDPPTDLYHPVRMVPREWLGEEGWASVSLRVGGDQPSPTPAPPPFVAIPEEIPELQWREIDPPPIEPPPIDRPITIPREPLLELRPRFRLLDDPAVKLAPEVFQVLDAIQVEERIRLGDGTTWGDVWKATRAVDRVAVPAPTTPPTSGFELSFDYRAVGIDRPWLQPLLLGLGGWSMPGFAPEAISNGLPIGNPGLMPVITTRLLVVRNLQVKAHWSDADRARADGAGTIAFGPFTITGGPSFDGSTLSHPGPQVVAWLATVVPPCPRAAD